MGRGWGGGLYSGCVRVLGALHASLLAPNSNKRAPVPPLRCPLDALTLSATAPAGAGLHDVNNDAKQQEAANKQHEVQLESSGEALRDLKAQNDQVGSARIGRRHQRRPARGASS